MGRSKSSSRWLQEHRDDHYVQLAQAEGFRSRAIYKLKEIDAKDRLFRSGQTVVDLGAAPGGWSEYAIDKVGGKGAVIAMDILPMDPINGVKFIEGDFREDEVLEAMRAIVPTSEVDLVISDMAPNISGIKDADQSRGIYLAELTLDFARESLAPGGSYLVKVFQGAGFEEFLKEIRSSFQKVVSRKPKASRSRSREIYLLGRNFKV